MKKGGVKGAKEATAPTYGRQPYAGAVKGRARPSTGIAARAAFAQGGGAEGW